MSGPELVVDVDLAVRRGTRLRARHVLCGSTVHTATRDRDTVDVGMLDVRDWRRELCRLCSPPVPDDAPAPPRDGPDLPWQLVLGSGAALAEHRADLRDALLARVDDALREQVNRLHGTTVGRLRAVGVAPSRRRVGWVSWLLFADGWRALTPYAAPGPAGRAPMVRLERRRPHDLARDVARWAAGARR
jgi:hypothetical protein